MKVLYKMQLVDRLIFAKQLYKDKTIADLEKAFLEKVLVVFLTTRKSP